MGYSLWRHKESDSIERLNNETKMGLTGVSLLGQMKC